ncbi:uncharacterized protein LOC143920158 [Arctopsyche grandis]|uniref:uncharacterized protein LOC143920158 n=1 Tax=Arctopsyche grandis TaxID=121162 RepID=UPI00406D66D0
MLTLVIFFILTVTIYLYITWNNNYWAKKKVPFDEPTFFLGSIKETLNGSKHFGVLYMDLYNKFKNVPYFGYFKLRDPALIVRDPELIKDILIKDYASFSSNDFQVDPEIDPIWGANIFSQVGDTWKKNRSAWSAALTATKIKAMYDVLNTKSDIMIDYIRKQTKNHPDVPIETRELVSKFFVDSILSSIVGLEFNSFTATNNPYRKVTQELFVSTYWDSMVTFSFMFFPGLAKIFGLRFVPKRIQNDLLVMAQEIIANRQKHGYQKLNPFDAILTHSEYVSRGGVSEMEVAGILFSFLLDGTETSAGVLAYLLYELGKNLDIQKRLRKEIDEAFESDNGNITFEKLNNLPYINMVLSETMRLYPPALSMQRLCTKPYSLAPIEKNDDPIKIPLGMPVIIPIYALHMDPKYYPEPKNFNPERFSEENKGNIPKYSYLPFGEGPRICIGFRLALNQTKIGLFHLLRNFEIRLAPQMQGKELSIDPNIFVMKAIGDLWSSTRHQVDIKVTENMWIFVSIIVILLLTLYVFITRNNNYWKERKVPYEQPKFFFGNFKDVFNGSKHFGMLYVDLYKQFKNAAYVGLYKLWTPAIMIRDPDLIRTVLVKDFQNFASNDFQMNPDVDPIMSKNIFNQTGEEWKKNRSAWTASMTSNKIKNAFEKTDDKCKIMIEHIKNHIKENPNEPLESRELSSKFFTDALVSSVFGLEMNSFVEKDNRYRNIITSFFQPNFWESFLLLVITIAPVFGKILRLRIVPKRVENSLIRIAKEVFDSRKLSGFQKTNSFDSILLHGGTKDNASLTDLDIGALVFGFLLDGTETSAGVSGFMLYSIAANPHIQKKLRNEIDQAAEANDGRLDYETIHKLSYLDLIMSETLRMYPPGLSIQRLCTKSYVLPPAVSNGEPYEVQVGTSVVVPIYALHMDPKNFPEPEKFDPERFNDENKNNIKKFTYIPFGEGPRVCIGARLAYNQTKIGIANIIKNFEIRLSPQMEGKPILIDPNVFILRAVGDLWLTFHNRADA